jgi:predicted ATPase
MSKHASYLSTFSVTNFKAIRNSGTIRFTPFTAIIGNNGSGKSSLIEALITYREFVCGDLDAASNLWRGFNHIVHKTTDKPGVNKLRNGTAVSFKLSGRVDGLPLRIASNVAIRQGGNDLAIEAETGTIGKDVIDRSRSNKNFRLSPADSVFKINPEINPYLMQWQFLRLNPENMGVPRLKSMTKSRIRLDWDGRNIGEFLFDLLYNTDCGTEVLRQIVEVLQFVLPYVKDLQPSLTSELEKNVYLQLTEGDFKVPGWLLSTGTLRIVALLAVLRHPNPPPLILIEELENGLDPRTIHLLIDEILSVTESGRTQVIATTHSPYLLDLLPLSSLLFVERPDGGAPVFSRPYAEKEKREWAESFRPGQLYTMSRLSSSKRRRP